MNRIIFFSLDNVNSEVLTGPNQSFSVFYTNMTASNQFERKLQFSPCLNTNPKKLKLKQIQDFNNYGFIFPVEVFSGEEINYHQKSFEELLIKARKKGFDSYSLAGWEEYVPYLYDICLNPAILDYVEDLI